MERAAITPRLLSREEAAAYVGLSPSQYDEEVRAGTFPQPYPLKKTRRRLFDRMALDRMLDARNAPLADVAHAEIALQIQHLTEAPDHELPRLQPV